MDQSLKEHLDRFLSRLAVDNEFVAQIDRLPITEQEFFIDAIAYAYHCGWLDRQDAVQTRRAIPAKKTTSAS